MKLTSYFNIFLLNPTELISYLHTFLRKYYSPELFIYEIEKPRKGRSWQESRYVRYWRDVDKDFIYVKGNIPILLAAHVDIHDKKLPTKIRKITESRIIAIDAPLAADDRAGVIAIMDIVKSGFRPHVLFTGGEERGYHGASNFVKNSRKIDVHLMISIDYIRNMRASFCDDEGLERYGCILEKYGFKSDVGSGRNDICMVSGNRGWNTLNGVNVSAGYDDWHQRLEYLDVDYLSNTINALKNFLRDVENHEIDMNECLKR